MWSKKVCIDAKDIYCNMLCLIPGQFIAYLAFRSKGCSLPWYTVRDNFPSIQNHNFMQYGLLHDTLSPEALQTTSVNKGDKSLHLATRSDTYISDINKTTQDDKYLWLGKDERTKYDWQSNNWV